MQHPNPRQNLVEQAMNQRTRTNRRFPRAALSSAVAAACLGMGMALAQTPAPAGGEGANNTQQRGRFSDRSAADVRAIEIDGRDHLPATSERELPKLSVVLGDPRALSETTQEQRETVPGAATPREDAHSARFESGEDLLLPADRARLDEIVALVKGRPGLRFEIVGHTDVQRISQRLQPRFPDNHALGLARARQVGRYLGEHLGLPASAFSHTSMGPDQPLAEPREDRANWAANRRVEVHVYWTEQAAPSTVVRTTVERHDPSACNMLSDYAAENSPL